ncbi:aldo/keto reductase [Fervidobacterium pennivorans subsp. shakshaketiis]|jgi:aryl-alcohol dehydrogenase-like predicted oxidoreductase|uniref:Oxidoreductase, aryl-alcohol dehydrogenase like protein n=1 Tax=Fervidobacterium pennivorans (strain DSM 9078 / Ven5) TaxID=771875 RepID=H9UCP2_FERPD|nr:aldo/keto reductase [Fervidobacterium pennivorans]AFG35285.1 putative oxidoreductase, aryl-alcohol dehydrogenase like protein [Fervidobacterium pennivorans DSM 9078]QIV78352.1 aldo/keto reductase [Fervidobacterium pennivorans subsp. keratinolyticus]
MNKRYVKRFNVYISEIGFGGWQLANPLWGAMTYEEGVKLVRAAYEMGINFFDTAPGYSNGLSERIIGEALKDVRENVFINTKFGHNHLGETDFSEEAIERSINESLKRLQTTYIDSVILHNPPREILEGKTNHEEEFKKIKRMGKIRGYGVSIDTLEELELVLNNWDVDVIEILFNIIHQSPKYLFDKVKERGILLAIKVPLDSGWLTGKYNANSKFEGIRARWSQDVILKRAMIVDKIKTIVKDEDLVKYAIGFILSFDAVTTVITGVKNLEQLESNIKASEFELSDELKRELERLYEEEIKPLNLPW